MNFTENLPVGQFHVHVYMVHATCNNTEIFSIKNPFI